jgi:hypothetical protein
MNTEITRCNINRQGRQGRFQHILIARRQIYLLKLIKMVGRYLGHPESRDTMLDCCATALPR